MVVILNDHEHQAAIGALIVSGSHRGSTCRALAPAGQFERGP